MQHFLNGSVIMDKYIDSQRRTFLVNKNKTPTFRDLLALTYIFYF